MLRYLFAVFLLSLIPAYGHTCGSGETSSMIYPIDKWVESCGYDVTCARPHHMGVDGVPKKGDVVGEDAIAPCSGVVKEARQSNGYGGIVILECQLEDRCVSTLIGHLHPDRLRVRVGDRVRQKDRIGEIAPRDTRLNGGFAPHIHFAVRDGAYHSSVYSGCHNYNVWTYAGYPGGCYEEMAPTMLNPNNLSEKGEKSYSRKRFDYFSDNNPILCADEPTGSEETDWHYSCERQTNMIQEGESIWGLLRIDDISRDHRFKIVAKKEGLKQWEWATNWNEVHSGWKHAYFWPSLQNADPGEWRFEFFVDTGDGFDEIPVAAIHFLVIPSRDPFRYEGEAMTCKGPISGGEETNWFYTCERLTSSFRVGETVQSLIRLRVLKQTHRYKVEAWKSGQFQWDWSPEPNVVPDGERWQYSHFWPTLSNAQQGVWTFKFFVDIGDGFSLIEELPFVVE